MDFFLNKEYLNSLNKEQYYAATTLDGPMLILAGAGSGKTHTIISRVSYMIDQGVDPSEILLLTFTNKAADEMINRIRKYCGNKAGTVTACTYHSFCAMMLRRYGDAIKIRKGFDILTPSQSGDAIGFTKAKLKEKYAIKGFPDNSKVRRLFSSSINLDKSIERVLLEDAVFYKYEKYTSKLEELFEDYQAYKREKSLMDYDDLMVKFYELLETCEAVRKVIEKTYTYIMVDEFQDTNNLQAKILQALRKDCKNIAVVGDDAQSIYKFRGANIKNIINFPKDYEGCKQIQLTENYRSSNEILRLANESYEKCACEGYPKRMKGQFNSGYKPVVIRPWDSSESDLEVVRGIKDIIERGISANRISVIFRNSRSSFGIEHLLNYEQISYEKRGGKKFLELQEVLDIIAYLRLSANPFDELSMFRLLQLHPDVGPIKASNICNLIGKSRDPIINNKYIKQKCGQELKILHNLMEESRLIEENDVEDKFKLFENFYINLRRRVIEEMNTDEGTRTGLLEKLETQVDNVKQLYEIVKSYDSIEKFLDEIVLEQARIEDDNSNKIVLTTIHSAKGLEFDTVFLLDCIDGAFPRAKPWEQGMDDEDIQEELRCFYVAITRAEKRLYILCPYRINSTSEFLSGELTRFLNECEETYTESETYIPLGFEL